jgi:hypothetical protein
MPNEIDESTEGQLTSPACTPDVSTYKSLDGMEHTARAATRGPWSRCTTNNGNCPCRTIWSKPLDDSPFCLAPSGPGEAVRIQDWDFVTMFDPPTALAFIAIVRAAQDVRVARRDGLRGDHEQDLHESLAQALDAAGFCKDFKNKESAP